MLDWNAIEWITVALAVLFVMIVLIISGFGR